MSTITAITLALLLGAGAPAVLAADSGREALAEAKRVNDGREHDEATQKMAMRIVSAGGRERRREIRTFTRRYDHDRKKTIAFFLGPSQVKDVAFLQWSYGDRGADQWLYLPALKRVRRIAQGLREESFQGSDFTYRDLDLIQNLLDWGPEKAEAELVATEGADGVSCAVIDLTPREPEGDYTSFRVWLDRGSSVMRRLEFRDADGEPVKVLALREYREVENVPVAHAMEMTDRKTGSTTFVTISDVRYDLGLPQGFFTERTLANGPSAVGFP